MFRWHLRWTKGKCVMQQVAAACCASLFSVHLHDVMVVSWFIVTKSWHSHAAVVMVTSPSWCTVSAHLHGCVPVHCGIPCRHLRGVVQPCRAAKVSYRDVFGTLTHGANVLRVTVFADVRLHVWMLTTLVYVIATGRRSPAASFVKALHLVWYWPSIFL